MNVQRLPQGSSASPVAGCPGQYIVQYRHACFRNLVSPTPGIIWVKNGTKQLAMGHHQRTVATGYMVVLPDNQPMAIENCPTVSQPYEARIVTIDRAVFETVYVRLGVTDAARRKLFATTAASEELAQAFLATADALTRQGQMPDAVLRHRCEELVIWLAEAGVCLPWATPSSTQSRIRALVSQRPGHKWTICEAGQALGMSQATIRRKLAVENTTFQSILSESRMATALALIQTTNWPIERIALHVGYLSKSRFVQRFQRRFGLKPAELRAPFRIAVPPKVKQSIIEGEHNG